MDNREILSRVDHTLLAPAATWEQIAGVIDEGIAYGTASVCIPPSFVKAAAAYSAGRVPVCTVIGFPNGYATTRCKVYEAWDACENGAAEIDMVINLGWAKSGLWDKVAAEVDRVKRACRGQVLKVIIETCLLTEAEIIAASKAVSETGADFIKTSTGFQKEGATFRAVELMKANCTKRVKAAGGIATLEDAKRFLALGASRLGTSRVVALVKVEGANGQAGAY